MDPTKTVLGLARWVWLLIAAALVVLAAWWVVSSLTSGKVAKARARLSESQTEAALDSGKDGVETAGRSIAFERHVEYITRENDRAILEAPGAAAPVDPELDRLARERLCQRAAYSEHPDCLLDAPAE